MTAAPLAVDVRAMTADDADGVRAVIATAFVDEPAVVGLQEALAARADNIGFVAVHEDRIVGHAGLTRCWIDAPDRLIEALVLSPLSVAPDVQRRGVGRALLDRAVAHAEAAGAPAVFLEGDPGYYGRLGWHPAAELGVTPASVRIPAPAFQCVQLSAYEVGMSGAMVYPDTFWEHDCVGLRGQQLADVLAHLA